MGLVNQDPVQTEIIFLQQSSSKENDFFKLTLLHNDYCEAIVLLRNIILFSSIIVFTVCVARNTRERVRHPLKRIHERDQLFTGEQVTVEVYK